MEQRYLPNTIHNYMLQPGDGTLYRFAFQYMPGNQRDNYTIEAGTGDADDEYIWIAINMAGGTAVGTIYVRDAIAFYEDPYMNCHIVDYCKSHGFQNVHEYTLVAVLMAVSALFVNDQDVDEACKRMRTTREAKAKMRERYG